MALQDRSDDPTQSLPTSDKIDETCRRFEQYWASGKRPRIDDFLPAVPTSQRLALLANLVDLEIGFRSRAGEQASIEDYRTRYPELSDKPPLPSHELTATWQAPSTLRPNADLSVRDEAPTPKQIDRYQIQRRLGRGAFGTVYLGWDPQLERQVAIKVPHRRDDAKQSVDDLLTEARRAVRLERHSGIVPVYDVGRSGGDGFIVSQYIDGGTLTDWMRTERPTVGESVRLMKRIADTVQFAHRHGWVHRDIKPSNILVDREGNPYLADFGLTSRLDVMRSTDSSPCGTPSYMAPELVRVALARADGKDATKEPRADHRSDIYSLGVVLYQLLTGSLPFQSAELEKLFDLVLHSDAPPPRLSHSEIPKRLEEVCLKALAKDPAQRYRTAADLSDDLQAIDRAISNSGALAAASRKKATFGVAHVAAIAIAGVLLLVVGVIFFVSSLPDRELREDPFNHIPVGNQLARASDPPIDRERLLAEIKELLDEQRQASPQDVPAPNVASEPSDQSEARQLPPPSSPSVQEGPRRLLLPAKYAQVQQQIEQARQKNDAGQEFSLLLNLNNKLIADGSYTVAEQVARRMVELSKTKPSQRPIAAGELGLVLARLGRYDDAIVNYSEAIKTYRAIFDLLPKESILLPSGSRSSIARLLGVSLMRLGNAHKHNGSYDLAEAAYAEARAVLLPFDDRKSELLSLLINQGILQSVRGDHSQAVVTLSEALELAQSAGEIQNQAEILVNLGNAQSRSGLHDEAILSFHNADKLASDETSYAFQSRLLTNWIQTLIVAQKPEEARTLLDRLRGVVREDDLTTSKAIELYDLLLGG